MKGKILLFLSLPLLLAACSKERGERQCVKGKIIAMTTCNKVWAVQIVEGPKIGESWQQYDNVIELYNVPADKMLRDTIYFTYRDKKPEDDKGVCLPIVSEPDYSTVEKTLLSLSIIGCKEVNR